MKWAMMDPVELEKARLPPFPLICGDNKFKELISIKNKHSDERTESIKKKQVIEELIFDDDEKLYFKEREDY